MPVKIKDSIYKIHRNYIKRDINDDNYIQLDRNESAFGYSKNVVKAIEEAQKRIARYPDIYSTSLRKKLAGIHNVSSENIVVGNGSFELITAVAQLYLNPGDEAITVSPTFEWYKTASLLANGQVVEIPLDKHRISLSGIKNSITERTRIIWLCNPNNPTGDVLPETEILQFTESIPPHILLVIDEAYIDFIREIDSFDSVELVKRHPNVILLRTFSKVYGLAALRVGYAIGHESVIKVIGSFKTPMSANHIAVEAAIASLNDKDFHAFVIEQTGKQLDYFYREFDRLGFPYIRSNANFVLVNVLLDSEEFVNKLKEKHILVRGGKEFGYPEWLRITIGTEQENHTLINELSRIYQETSLSVCSA